MQSFLRMGYRGFSLIELLIVVTIIGILALAVIYSVSTASLQSQDAAIKAELINIKGLAEIYFAEQGQTYGEEWSYDGNNAPATVTTELDGMILCPTPSTAGTSMFHAGTDKISPQINRAIKKAVDKSSATDAGCVVRYDNTSGIISWAVAIRAADINPSDLAGTDRFWWCLDNNSNQVQSETELVEFHNQNINQYDFEKIVEVINGEIRCK